jgi:hypothetical protein
MFAVVAHFEADGWVVEDVSAQDGLGYDLVATDGDQVLYVEVKATAGTRPWVWFTRSEIQAAEAYPEQWRAAVVTRARSPEPDELQWFTAAAVIDSAQPDRFRARLGAPSSSTAWPAAREAAARDTTSTGPVATVSDVAPSPDHATSGMSGRPAACGPRPGPKSSHGLAPA